MNLSATPMTSLTEDAPLVHPLASRSTPTVNRPTVGLTSLGWGFLFAVAVMMIGWWNEWRWGVVDLVSVALLARAGFVQIRHAALASLMAILVWSFVRSGEMIPLGHVAYARWMYFAFLWLIIDADPDRSRFRTSVDTETAHHGEPSSEESDDAESNRNKLVWFGVPLLFLLSARWDESFLAAIVILGVQGLGRAIDLWIMTGRWNEPLQDRLFCRSLWLTEMAFAATLFTPRGPTLWIDLVEQGLGRVSLFARAESLGTVLTSHAFAFCVAGLGLWIAMIHSRRCVLTADLLLVGLFAIGLIWEPASVACAVPIIALVALPHLASLIEQGRSAWSQRTLFQAWNVTCRQCARFLGGLTNALRREDSHRENVLQTLTDRWGMHANGVPVTALNSETSHRPGKKLGASLCQIALAGLLIGWCASSYREHLWVRSRPMPRVRPLRVIPLPLERPFSSKENPFQLVSHTEGTPPPKLLDVASLSHMGRLVGESDSVSTAVVGNHTYKRSCFARLAALAEQGMTIDARCPGDSDLGTKEHRVVRDVWDEAIRTFRLPERSRLTSSLTTEQQAAIQSANRELAEATIAFALLMPEARYWYDKEGRLVTFDLLAERLVEQTTISTEAPSSTDSRIKPLVGRGHYALSLLLRADDQCGCLSRTARDLVWNHLRQESQRFASTLGPHEPWNASSNRDVLNVLNEKAADVVSTLEWWSIAPQGLRPQETVQRQAVEWLIHYVEEFSQSHKAQATSSPMRCESPPNSVLLRVERVLTHFR